MKYKESIIYIFYLFELSMTAVAAFIGIVKHYCYHDLSLLLCREADKDSILSCP